MQNRHQMKAKPLIVIKPKIKPVQQSTYSRRFKQLFKMCQQFQTAKANVQMEDMQKRAASSRSYQSVLPQIKQKQIEEQQIPESSYHTTRTYADHPKQLPTTLNSRETQKGFRSVAISGRRVAAFKQSDARPSLQIDVRKLIGRSKSKQKIYHAYKGHCE